MERPFALRERADVLPTNNGQGQPARPQSHETYRTPAGTADWALPGAPDRGPAPVASREPQAQSAGHRNPPMTRSRTDRPTSKLQAMIEHHACGPLSHIIAL